MTYEIIAPLRGQFMYVKDDQGRTLPAIITFTVDADGNLIPVGTDGGTIMIYLPGTPTIFNLDMPIAGQEYPQAFAGNTLKLSVQMRNMSGFKYAWVAGETDINWVTVPSGCSYVEDGVKITGKTLYIQPSSPDVAEITQWT